MNKLTAKKNPPASSKEVKTLEDDFQAEKALLDQFSSHLLPSKGPNNRFNLNANTSVAKNLVKSEVKFNLASKDISTPIFRHLISSKYILLKQAYSCFEWNYPKE